MTTEYATLFSVSMSIPIAALKKPPKLKETSQQVKDDAQCDDSPTGYHQWQVSPLPAEIHYCPWCKGTRQYKQEKEPTPFMSTIGPKTGKPVHPQTMQLQTLMLGMQLHTTIQANHDHLKCYLKREGHSHSCGLGRIIGRLRERHPTKDWVSYHTKAHEATVVRTR